VSTAVLVREAPRIETERLVLRHWRKDDLRPWLEVMQRPETNRFLGSAAITPEDLWRRLSAAVGSWSLMGFGGWAVTHRDSDQVIGNVGFFNAWRDLEPVFGEDPEMGWIFSPDVQGHGYAMEAGRAALGWAQESLAPTAMWAIIAPGNEPSIRLARKLGFEPVHETTYHDEPTLVLRRPAWG